MSRGICIAYMRCLLAISGRGAMTGQASAAMILRIGCSVGCDGLRQNNASGTPCSSGLSCSSGSANIRWTASSISGDSGAS